MDIVKPPLDITRIRSPEAGFLVNKVDDGFRVRKKAGRLFPGFSDPTPVFPRKTGRRPEFFQEAAACGYRRYRPGRTKADRCPENLAHAGVGPGFKYGKEPSVGYKRV